MILLNFAALAIALVSATSSTPVQVHSAADAIKMADDASERGKSGRFELTVQSTDKTNHATFLNSTDDYRRPDDLTVSFLPVVARELAKKYGAAPEQYFKDKTIVVDGVVARDFIVNTISGRPHSANRWQHTIKLEHANQIVSVR